MRFFLFCLLALGSSLALAQPDVSKVNGDIHVEVGGQYGQLSTVNGSVRVESAARVGDISTVNGSVVVGENARTGAIKTVNGAIHVGENVLLQGPLASTSGPITVGAGSRIDGGLSAVNGSVRLTRAELAGSLASVTGDIRLEGAKLMADLETVDGDIVLGRDSHVHGDVRVRKPGGVQIGSKAAPPRVVIGAGARLDGQLIFEREVELEIDPSAAVPNREPVYH